MCGIVGFLGRCDNARRKLDDMMATLKHRGPDEQDCYTKEIIHLGHTRLSVIDLHSGRQPLENEDGTVWTVFNGEIYNYKALRKELIECGHKFKTNTDTEVLIHGYEEWGRGVLDRLQGMFAFALWDWRNQTLFVARDPFGIKPFYYTIVDNTFVFASELKAILQFSSSLREIDLESIGLFLERQFIPEPRTIYKNIKKLRHGFAMVLSFDNQIKIINEYQYFKIDYSQKLSLNENELCEGLDAALKASVRSMLVCDVPLGVFLSGGIDSSLIAALASREVQNLQTFTIGFYGKDSEHEFASKVATHIGATQNTLMLNSYDVLAKFDYWSDIFDEPFADQAALPTLLLAEFASKSITVALTGEGADEVFGGYFNYPTRLREEKLTHILGHGLSPLPHIAKLMPAIIKKDRIISSLSEPKSRRYVAIPNVFDKALASKLFSKEFLLARQKSMADYAEIFYNECNSQYYLDKILHIDLNLWLPDDLLTKVDRATMAYSLEARVPYLDQEFIKFTSKIKPDFKVNGKTGKYILKKLASQYLPNDIVYRHKQGFVMPLSEWMANELKPLAKDALESLSHRGIFTKDAIAKLQAEHFSGRKNHSGRIWTLLILEKWFRKFDDGFKI